MNFYLYFKMEHNDIDTFREKRGGIRNIKLDENIHSTTTEKGYFQEMSKRLFRHKEYDIEVLSEC